MWTLQRKSCLSFVVAKLQVNAWDSRSKKLGKNPEMVTENPQIISELLNLVVLESFYTPPHNSQSHK